MHFPPARTPTEGEIGQCAVCDARFLGAILEDDRVHWIPLRWWHRGFLRSKLDRFPKP